MNNSIPISDDIALPVLIIKDGHPVTSSLDVAKVFGKRHHHVMDVIRNIDLPEEFIATNFRGNEYTDSIGRKLPCYDLTRDGFTFLVMGFTGKEANLWKMRYIEAFNAMETELLKQTQPRHNPFSEYPVAAEIIETNLRVAQLLKVPAHLAQIESIKVAHRETGVDFHHLLAYAPAQSNVPNEDMMLEPRDLSIRFGIDHSGRTLNKMLEHIGWQKRVNDIWQPTEAGKPYCQIHSWKAGTKCGYNLKWRVEAVQHELQKYDLPRVA